MEREQAFEPNLEYRSVRQELSHQASQLGLPDRETILPETELSPHNGDPTAVDDRPFAASLFYLELAAELEAEGLYWF